MIRNFGGPSWLSDFDEKRNDQILKFKDLKFFVKGKKYIGKYKKILAELQK